MFIPLSVAFKVLMPGLPSMNLWAVVFLIFCRVHRGGQSAGIRPRCTVPEAAGKTEEIMMI